MAETLGSLCDKLTIVKLKQYHSDDAVKQASLARQEDQLINEIDVYLDDVVKQKIPAERLVFEANKVYKKQAEETAFIQGKIGEVFARLANVNCTLWHEQEKVYEFEKVLPGDKDKVIKNLAVLNLDRTRCIDKINELFKKLVAPTQ